MNGWTHSVPHGSFSVHRIRIYLPASRFAYSPDLSVTSVFASYKICIFLWSYSSICFFVFMPQLLSICFFLSFCFSFPSCSVRSSSPFSYKLHCPIWFRCAHGSVFAMLYIPPNLTKKIRIMPTQCIYVFHMVLTINSDCFSKQH
jgi:hypothetical protein